MPYRDYPRVPEYVPVEEPDAPLRRFDVSGKRGHNGRHGSPGLSGTTAGEDGQRGGDAGPAEPGQAAGWVRLELATADVDGMARVQGTLVLPAGERKEFSDVVPFGERGFIELVAVGGDGGTGGNGGAGGDGAQGRRGRDATRWSSGSDGGPGGDGGAGGKATSGGGGGQGGDITLVVEERDTQLLMLIQHWIHGGQGGEPGANGMGGMGGAGGPGGSSYSWSETETYTDSQGKTQTRSRHHYSPGGSRGPAGSPGSPGMARVRRGANGETGSFAIEVKTAEGMKTYESRYDVRLIGFAHESANRDCVYEPQETIRVFDIEVENTGGMPTPAHRDIELSLVQSRWVAPREERLVLPRSLGPGERCRLEGQALHFVIGDYQPRGPDARLEVEEAIRHRARLPSVYRDFADYEHEGSREQGLFLIRFPVRVEPIVSLYSLAPGQTARMRWTVTNQSLAALGAASAEKRVVRVRLMLHESELDGEKLVCKDERGERVDLAEGFCRDIEHLGPGESAHFEIALGIAEHAPHYGSARLWLALELGFLDEPGKARPVQFQEFCTRVARPYQPVEDADLLVVVNHRTTREAVEAWRALAGRMGFRLNTWDISLQRGLDLDARARGARSLIQELQGRTIVVCDNAIDSAAGATWPRCFMDKQELFAALDENINLVFLGGSFDLQSFLIPTHHDELAGRPGKGESPAELLAALTLARTERASPLERTVQSAPVHARQWLWSRPGTPTLVARAFWLQRRLCDLHPDRRYVVIYDDASREVVSKFLWVKRWRLGTLTVRGTLDTAAGAVVHVAMTDEHIHEPARILGETQILAILLTRSLDEKLDRLEKLLYPDLLLALSDGSDSPAEQTEHDSDGKDSRLALIELVCDAICADLAGEQQAILATGWRAGLSADDLRRSLPLLGRLAQFRVAHEESHAPDSPEGAKLVRMAARLRFLFESQARLWEWPLYVWRRGPCVRRISNALLGEFLDHAFGAVDDAHPLRRAHGRAARRLIKAEVRLIGHQHRQARELEPEWKRRSAYGLALLRTPLEREGVTTGAEVLGPAESRVLSREEYDALCAADQSDAIKRSELMNSEARARDELLIT